MAGVGGLCGQCRKIATTRIGADPLVRFRTATYWEIKVLSSAAGQVILAVLEKKVMNWLTRRTSIVGVKISNWEIAVGAIAVIIVISILIHRG